MIKMRRDLIKIRSCGGGGGGKTIGTLSSFVEDESENEIMTWSD